MRYLRFLVLGLLALGAGLYVGAGSSMNATSAALRRTASATGQLITGVVTTKH